MPFDKPIMNYNWLYKLDDNIHILFDNLRSADNKYHYLPATGGVSKEGKKILLGFSCYALKTYYMTGLWDKLSDIEKNNWLDYINSFQDINIKYPANSFLDYSYIEGFRKTQNKKVLKNTIKLISNKAGFKKYQTISAQLQTNVRAESKQAISSLIQVGGYNKFPYLEFPNEKLLIPKFLNSLDWNQPWSAGAQYSGICLFAKTQIDKNKNLIEELVQFSNKMVKKDTGGYYKNNCPSKKELINGAMKMISGFDWIDQEVHYPKKLIDLCLDTTPSSEGCDLVDIVYVLYMCSKQTNYKRLEIINYFNEMISVIYIHYYKNQYGFSYFKNKSQTHYYGAKITEGKDFPDIHGTILLIWALSMIIEINEINLSWKTLKP